MPSRAPLDETVVLTVYQETGSGRETARRLGVHENSVYQVLKRHKGLCVRCGRTVDPGKKHCPACLKTLRESIKRKRNARRRQGLCAQCNTRIQAPSTLYCAKHRLQHIDASEHYRQRTQAQREANGAYGPPLPAMREKHLRYNYGEAGVNVWRMLDGRCILCRVPHAEKAVHVHHIDGDDTNHTESNLTCLCRRCHHMVHALVAHPAFAHTLTWLRKTYPALDWPMWSLA